MSTLFTPEVLTVSELTNQIKQTLEDNYSRVSVIGEISNFKPHISGHWYFSIKDSNAVISCTMWKGYNNFVFFTPRDGMKVILNGKITVYPPKGNYQLEVRSMKPAGEGELQAAFEYLKQKLAKEGLFNEEHKKKIPRFPGKIGIITAKDSAAFKDMISVADRRYPLAELLVVPAKVQGTGAAEDVIRSLRLLNKRNDVDVIILARGGGSIEDLWAFNEEKLAREIFKSRIPVITGIGHEIDFTIADFVADLRAPTPSAAMELATPRMQDILSFMVNFYNTSYQSVITKCGNLRKGVLSTIRSYAFKLPESMVKNKAQQLDSLIDKIIRDFDNYIKLKESRLNLLTRSIEMHNIQKTLKRGFVLVKQDSKYITRSKSFDPDNSAILKFYDDELTVLKKK